MGGSLGDLQSYKGRVVKIESKLQSDIIKYLKDKGCYVVKLPAGYAGVSVGSPDLLAIYKSIAIIIEVKTDIGGFKPLQVETIAELSHHGFGFVAYPSNWGNLQQKLTSLLESANSLVGLKFGRLKVLSIDPYETDKQKKVVLKCLCDCGNVVYRKKIKLTRGGIQSCGCYNIDRCRAMSEDGGKKNAAVNSKRGDYPERLSTIWYDMQQRCYNEKCKNYQWYGAKGIAVCDEWSTDRMAFFEWAFANGYESNLTIDRIDDTDGYSPENCQWATKYEQTQNKTNTHYYNYMGDNYTLKELSEMSGLKQSCIKSRIEKQGLSVEKAVNTPSKKTDYK